MKKIKGSLKAIRMSHLVVMFALITVACTAIRTHQLLNVVNLTNGFFENSDFTVPLLYGLLAVGSVLFLILSFLSKNVPSPKLTEGRNIPLGMASFVAAIGFVWDIIVIAKIVIPANNTPYGINTNVFDMLMNSYIKDNGGVFLVLQFVFAILSVFYFIVFGMSHFEGKATYKKISLLSIAPGCWAMFVLISKLMKAVSFITVSELLFEIGMLTFTMIFFLTFARIASGVFSVNSMWCTYGCGFPAAVFAGLISVPRGISLIVGNGTVEGNDFSFTHLFLFIFIIVYIISTLGAGFKNSLKKMRSVSNIVLPDDDEVVVKSSEASAPASTVEVVLVEENTEKKKRFSIAPEFKNIPEISSFFDDEVEDTVKEEVEDYEEKVDEEAYEASDEVDSQIDDVIASEESSQEIDTDPVEEIAEASPEADGEDACEEASEEVSEEFSEEATEEISEEVTESDEEEFDFELTDIFAEKQVVEENHEVSAGIISEEIVSEAVIYEPVEVPEKEEKLSEEFEEVIAEPVAENDVFEQTEDIVADEPEKSSVKTTGGFLEFSQMLIDDFDDEDLTDAADEKKESVKKAEEIKATPEVKESETTEPVKSEKVKKEKVKKEKAKKEKVKKEKIKKEKVKKEKPEKPSKSFGRKKKTTEDEEPLKIVSLADLKNKQD